MEAQEPKQAPTGEPAGEALQAAEPKESAEPRQAAEPEQPAEPKEVAEPRQAAEPKQKAEPAQGAEARRAVEPDQAAEPAQAVEAAQAAAPEHTAEPEQTPSAEDTPQSAQAEPAPTVEHALPAQDWERVPGAAAERAAAEPPRPGRGRGVWLVIVGAALLGLAVGVALVLRGRSLGASPASDTVSRPTFVIGAAVSPIPSQSPSPAARTATLTEYVVQPGDTLRSIAQTVYGDADQWPRIYAANRDAIGADPDTLQAGMRLRIP
jgi:nucleoid-associated protein YgaU